MLDSSPVSVTPDPEGKCLLRFLRLPCEVVKLGQIEQRKQEVFVHLDAESLQKYRRIFDEENTVGYDEVRFRRFSWKSNVH